MAVNVLVLYEDKDNSFKLDYYLQKHMPLVLEKFGPHGMTGYTVTKLEHTATGDKPLYSITATLAFGAVEQANKALEAEGAQVLGDIPNFSSTHPIISMGEVVDKKGTL